MCDCQHSVDAGFNREMAPVKDDTYQGWKNYPTWAVNMWLTNDEGWYCDALDIVRVSREHHATLQSVSLRQVVADYLQEWVVNDLAPDLGASFAADLLGFALGQVDWREIATAWLAPVS